MQASILGAVTKPYDGTKDVPAGHGLPSNLVGIIDSANVTATISFAYGSVNAGTRTIIANIELQGLDVANYKLESTSVSAEVGDITRINPQYAVPTGLQAVNLGQPKRCAQLRVKTAAARIFLYYKSSAKTLRFFHMPDRK